jgi:hypothetical protein
MDFEGIYCFDTATVRFAFYPEGPEGPRVIAQISEETLHDEFGVSEVGDQLLDACKKYFHVIEPAAVACYRAAPHRPVTLRLEDFPPGARALNPAAADASREPVLND